MKNLAILGSTGSIGTQALDVAKAFPDLFNITGLSAHQNTELFKQQIKTFKPEVVAITSPEKKDEIETFLKTLDFSCQLISTPKALEDFVDCVNAELLLVSVVGTASLMPTYKAIQRGMDIGLACKEVLVAAGDILMEEAKKHQVNMLPVDSEHAALKQCLASVGEDKTQVKKLILTASGGPFWQKEKSEFEAITKADALKHPSWEMGNKITIDSATLVNKGLEVIEAHHLYQIPYEQIEVVIHPKSIVHSFVEFIDGNVLAHCGYPDMRYPIQYALTYPDKYPNNWNQLQIWDYPDLQFFKPDYEKFTLLKTAFEVGKKKGSAPVIFNAANEAAVSLFLQEKIRFVDIPAIINEALESTPHQSNLNINEIVALDRQTKHNIAHAYVT